MASRHLVINAKVKLPEGDDIFAHATAISRLQGAVEAVKAALPQELEADVTHSIVHGRVKGENRRPRRAATEHPEHPEHPDAGTAEAEPEAAAA